MTKRQDGALATRKKLIDSAEKMLSQKGFNSLSVEDITRESGVAKGTFYVYFKHKEEILTEICRGYFKKIENTILEMSDKSIVEKLSVYIDNFMSAVEIYGINICREWIKGVIDPNNDSDGMDKNKWQYDTEMLSKILTNAVHNNELRDNTPIELVTHILISELYGMMTCWCMSNGVFEPKDWTRKFSEFQLKAMLGEYLVCEE